MNSKEKDSCDTAYGQFVMASQACAKVEECIQQGRLFEAGMVFQQSRERLSAGLSHLTDLNGGR